MSGAATGGAGWRSERSSPDWMGLALRAWEDAARRARVVSETAFPPRTPRPAWATPNVRRPLNDTVALRVFDAPADEAGAEGDGGPAATPVLVVTPQVNHSYIADFSPQQSLVRTLLAAGVRRVGVTDWAAPPRDRTYTIADSIDDIRAAIEALGGRAHVVGLCQGGWQAAVVAALAPAEVASLTVAAAPIDAHAGTTPLHAFTFGLPLAFFRGLVALGGGNAPSALLSFGFDTLKPFERFWGSYASLWLAAHDEGFVARYRALRNWYRLRKDIAGALYIEAVRDLFMENRLAGGTFAVRGERVDLGAIRCPVFAVAGERDHITPPPQVLALPRLAPAAPARCWTVDAGHIGVFMGRRALATVWPEIGAALAAA